MGRKKHTTRLAGIMLAAVMMLTGTVPLGFPAAKVQATGWQTDTMTPETVQEDIVSELSQDVTTDGNVNLDIGHSDETRTGFEAQEDDLKMEQALEEQRPDENKIVNFMVVLDKKPMLDRFSSAQIRTMNEEVLAYKEELTQALEKIKAELINAFGEEEGFAIGYEHTISTTSLSVTTRYGNREAIEAMEEVEAVYVAPTFTMAVSDEDDEVSAFTENATDMIGADRVNQSGYSGKGMKIAIIDTGIVADHPSFRAMSNDKITSTSMTEDFVENIWEMTNAGQSTNARNLAYRTNKLPFIFNYYGRNFDVSHETAGHDHGTHVAGIAAANHVEGSDVIGVAPDAQLVVMQVFSPSGGAEWSTILTALEDCVVLGVDSANLSLGSAAGFSDGDKEIIRIIDRFKDTETNIVIAGGNDTNNALMNLLGTDMSKTKNIDNGLIGTPATAPGALAVASAENDATILPYFTVDGNKFAFNDTAVTSQTRFLDQFNNQQLDFVYISGVGKAEDYAGKDVQNKAVIVSRGEISFQDKQKIAKEQGAKAVIVYNNTLGRFSMEIADGSGHIPCISISQKEGEMLEALEEGRLAVGGYSDTIKVYMDRAMSDFSSWGVTPDLKLKPEITGVGGNIYSTRDPSIGGSNYGNMSGTSMASPQVTGAITVLQQYLRTKNPSRFQGEVLRTTAVNLLMSTANQILQGSTYYSPRNQGAGLVNLKKATTAEAFLSVPAAYEGRPKAELGDDDNKEGVYSFEFTINNFSAKDKSYTFDSVVMTADVDETKQYMSNSNRNLNAKVKVYENEQLVGSVSVSAGAAVTLTAEITLTSDDKNFIEANFCYGNFVEGFLYAEEGGGDGVTLSLPFLGFFGDWSDSPVFDDEGEAASLQRPVISTRKGKLGQNPYITGGKAGDKYNAVSLTNPIEEMRFGMMRNSRRVTQTVTSADGRDMYFNWSEDYVIKTHYNASYGMIVPYNLLLAPEYDVYIWDGTNNGKALPDNTKATYTITSYIDDGDDKADDVYSFDITMDNTSPVIENAASLANEVIKDKEQGKVLLPLKLRDNHYIAAVMFEDTEGNILGKFEVDNKPGETVSKEFDVTGFGTNFNIVVGDYAANETEYEVTLDLSDMSSAYPPPIELSKDKIYGFETYSDGYVNMGWFSAQKEDFSNLRNETYADFGDRVYSAEYINGYVIGQRTSDGAIVLYTPYSSSWNTKVIYEQTGKGTSTDTPGLIVLYDMAFDYSTETLYAVGWEYKGDINGDSKDDGYNGLFRINLEETVSIEKVAEIQGKKGVDALTLACTTEGQLYTITTEGKLYRLDKTNGTIELIGTTSFTQEDNYSGVNVIQSMCYDHNTDEVYWYAHSQTQHAGQYVNVGAMYKVNLENAALTKIGASGSSGYTSLFIPSEERAESLEFGIKPTGLVVSPEHTKIVIGQTKRLSVNWTPWNSIPGEITWSSEDEDVAVVNDNGVVTAVAAGATKITASISVQGETKEFKATIEVLESAGDLYGFLITDHNGKIPNSKWITYADNNVKNPKQISGPGGMIQGGAYYNGYLYYVIAEAVSFGTANTKFYKAPVNKGASSDKTTIGSGTLISTIPEVELGNLSFDYTTGRMYGIDYTNGGLLLVDIETGEIDRIGTFKGDLQAAIMPAMCVTAKGNIIGSDMFGNLYHINPDTMYARKIGSIGEDSWYYAGMGYDYNTGNIYWNPCMGEGYSDMYMVVIDEEINRVNSVEIINLGAVAGDSGVEQTVIFTIPDEELETAYIQAQSIEITNENLVGIQGGTMQLNTVTDPIRPTISAREWSSSNDRIASVDQYGKVTLKQQGEVTITVTVRNKGANPDPEYVTDSVQIRIYGSAGEFVAFLAADEGASSYYDFWIEMKDSNLQDSKTKMSMIGTYSLRTGEYYDGYLYAYSDTELLYRINAENYNDYITVGTAIADPAERIVSISYDYKQGKMYGLRLSNRLVTIDLASGAVTDICILSRKTAAIAFDNHGQLFGVGSEQLMETSYLYRIDKVNGTCTVDQSFDAGIVWTGDNYYFERMYSPQMTYDHGTNRFYLNATIKVKASSSLNMGFFMIQLKEAEQETEEGINSVVVNNSAVNGNTVSGNTLSGNTLSGNTLSGNTLSGNTLSGNTVSGNEVSDHTDGKNKDRSVSETGSTRAAKRNEVDFIANLGKPALNLSRGVKVGDMHLGLLVSIPEEGEILFDKVTGLRIDREKARLAVNDTTTLNAIVSPSALDPDVDRSVIWTSENPDIATVNAATGKVTAVAIGNATITAASRNNPEIKASCEIKVVEQAANASVAYTISADREKIISFNPELPQNTVKEIAKINGGRNVVGMTMKDENHIYYLTEETGAGPWPKLHLFDLRTKKSQTIGNLHVFIGGISDIAYDRENGFLYVASGFYVFQFEEKYLRVSSNLIGYALYIDTTTRSEMPYSQMHGVTTKDGEVYFLGSANKAALYKTDDKFITVEKVRDVNVNTVSGKCELEYDSNTGLFYLTDAGDRLYSFTEDPDAPVEAIDIVGNGIDINGLAIKPGN